MSDAPGRPVRARPRPWGIAKVVATGAVLGALALALWLALSVKGVLLLAMLAVLFAVLLDACARLLGGGAEMPRWAALVAVFFFAGSVLGGAGLLIAPQVSEDVSHLGERIPQAIEELEDRVIDTAWGGWVNDQLTQLEESTSARDAVRRFLGFFSTALGATSGSLAVLVVGLFIAAEPDTYVRGALRLLPPHARPRGREVARELGHALRWWLLGRLASMFIVFVFTLIGLLLLGIPLPFLLALIAGVFSFVPTFGPIASAVPALLVALSLGPDKALSVALLYLGIQLIESYSITPFIERRTVRLTPALLVVFQLAMGVLAGILGVMLATPLLVVLTVLAGMLYVEDGLHEESNLP